MINAEPTILFFQGGGEGAYREDKMLADYLHSKLGKKYRVLYPRMPDEENPDYDSWKPTFDQQFQNIKAPLLLVGHSVGSILLIHYLSENQPHNDIRGVFLLATPFLGDKGWEYEGFKLDDELASRLPAAPIFMYHGTDDKMVPFFHLQLYAGKIPQATIRPLEGMDHQLNNDLSAVVADILGLPG